MSNSEEEYRDRDESRDPWAEDMARMAGHRYVAAMLQYRGPMA